MPYPRYVKRNARQRSPGHTLTPASSPHWRRVDSASGWNSDDAPESISGTFVLTPFRIPAVHRRATELMLQAYRKVRGCRQTDGMQLLSPL